MTDRRDRLEQLLVDEAVGGLSVAESNELNELLAQHADVDRHAYERAASTFFIAAVAGSGEKMPDELSAKLAALAENAGAGIDR